MSSGAVWWQESLPNCLIWDNVDKYFRAGQATDDNTAHTQCMLDT